MSGAYLGFMEGDKNEMASPAAGRESDGSHIP